MNDDRPQNSLADHDLLIKLDTKFDLLSDKFDTLSLSIVSRVDQLEKDMITVRKTAEESGKGVEEVKADVKFLNRYAWMAIGAVAVLELYLLYKQAFHP